MSCVLAIYDCESEYANHLMDYINRKQKLLTQVRVFTNHKSLKEYLDHNQIHILLLSESIPIEEILHENIKNICILSEGNYIHESLDYPVIYKFQSADMVMQELFSYYSLEQQMGKKPTSIDNNVRIISIFSIARETEQMILSLSLAQQYAKQKKTLYINLDIYQALPELSEYNSERNLSEFIYYLKQNNPNLLNKMNGIISKADKLDYIQGVKFGPDLYELTSEDMIQWVKELKKSTQHEIIIFHVGSFFHATLELFRQSNQLLLLLGDNQWDQSKYKNLQGQLLWAGYNDVLQKVEVIPLTREKQEEYLSYTNEDIYSNKSSKLVAPYI